MRIFLNGMAASAGAGLTYLYNVVPRLSKISGVHTILAVQRTLRADFAKYSSVSLAAVPEISSTLGRFAFEQFELPGLIRESGTDVLISAGNFALRSSPVPQILLSGNSLYTSADFERDLLSRREYRMWLGTRVRGIFAKKSVQWAECTLAPSQAFADQLQSWTGKPVETIYHGFAHEQFFRDDSPLAPHIQKELESARDCLRLLFVSHYNYYRNLDTLFRAVPLICGRLPERHVRLFLTCHLQDSETPGGYKTKNAAALIAHLGIRDEVRELGAVPYPSLHHLYQACDVYVTSAYAETFAHPLVEAMACGLPIVASDLTVHREVAGNAALYFDRFSPEQLAEAVARIASHHELKCLLSFNGKQRSTDFSWTRHVAELVEIARRMVSPTQVNPDRMSA